MGSAHDLSRRSWLRAASGALTPFLGRPAAAAEQPGKTAGTAKSVILIFNDGAPSHLDLFDPKPDSPPEIRGDFATIPTAVPGIRVTELIPDLAKRMDKLAIVRSVHHEHSSHNGGMHWATVGRPYRVDSTLITPSPTDIPCFGTLIGWLAQRDGFTGEIPPYVITPQPHCDSRKYETPGQFGGCLGVKYDPFVLGVDPNAPDYKVPSLALHEDVSRRRFDQRLGLLNQLQAPEKSAIATPAAAEVDAFNEKAVTLLQSGTAAEAFDLSKEPEAIRQRYGRHRWGQSHLLARRLIERGTKFVTTNNGPSIIWDTHDDNTNRLKNKLVPPMQQAFCALLDDLEERGLLDETLVIWMGDFGRAPKINDKGGRDHWPNCYSVVLAGGGVRGGQVVGASDKIGGYPFERPVSPADIHATAYEALGYDYRSITFQSSDGRPMPLTEGKAIRELLG